MDPVRENDELRRSFAPRSYAALLWNSFRLDPAHFESQLPREKTLELFRNYVEVVEIETCSFCNRQCSFCPNSFLDRHGSKKYMPQEVWQTIIGSLSRIGYNGALVWARFAEPLADAGIITKIREARKSLPKCSITLISNGDYLTPDLMKELSESGVNRLILNIYLPAGTPYSTEAGIAACEATANRIHCELKRMRGITGFGDCAGMLISISAPHYTSKENATDRGGLLQQFGPFNYQRTSPCFIPVRNVTIDWNGSVMPCCQLRSDAPEHAQYVIGKINRQFDCIDAYAALSKWRMGLCRFGTKALPCLTCSDSPFADTRLTRNLHNSILTLSLLPQTRILFRTLTALIGRRKKRFKAP
jgi:hypothetical protein